MNMIVRGRAGSALRVLLSGLLAMAFVYAVLFVPLPYYVFQPGTADGIRDMVAMEDAAGPETGTLLMTTVGVTRSTVAKLAEAEIRGYDIRKITDLYKDGETGPEYDERQHYIMLTSESDAIQAAYRKAGAGYRTAAAGVSVLKTRPEGAAAGILLPGDRIVKVEGREVRSGAELALLLGGYRQGDSVSVEYRRGDVELEAELTLKKEPAPSAGAGETLGFGAVTADLQRIEPEDPARRVTIQAGDIGGPSAGLMFALEVYSRLTPGDLTKGYAIAGTGTIDPEGTVGVIGGIRHKVAAAAHAGADLFFAPKDWVPSGRDGGDPVPNASEAQDEARKLRTDMLVVPVGSLDEAVAYLEKLPPKGGNGE